MQAENKGFSKDNLLKFLNFAGKSGMIKQKTISNRITACNTILSVLSENETADLSKLDLELVITRHRNKAVSTIPPKSLSGYESHFRGAMRDFFEYTKNPSSWRPGIKTRTQKVKEITPTEKSISHGVIEKPDEVIEEEKKQKYPSVHIDLQIHISPEAKPEQIDKIFASMREHLYPKND